MQFRLKPCFLICVSLCLLLISLWQLEIVFIDIYWNHSYCFPFDAYCTNQFWVIRDFYYSLIILSFLIMLINKKKQ